MIAAACSLLVHAFTVRSVTTLTCALPVITLVPRQSRKHRALLCCVCARAFVCLCVRASEHVCVASPCHGVLDNHYACNATIITVSK